MLVAMPEKKAILNLRLDPETRNQFAIAAKLRGASMSGLLHQFIVRTIREEKAEAPQAFKGRSKTDEINRRLQGGGIPLAPNSEHTIPAKIDDKRSKTGRRERKG